MDDVRGIGLSIHVKREGAIHFHNSHTREVDLIVLLVLKLNVINLMLICSFIERNDNLYLASSAFKHHKRIVNVKDRSFISFFWTR